MHSARPLMSNIKAFWFQLTPIAAVFILTVHLGMCMCDCLVVILHMYLGEPWSRSGKSPEIKSSSGEKIPSGYKQLLFLTTTHGRTSLFQIFFKMHLLTLLAFGNACSRGRTLPCFIATSFLFSAAVKSSQALSKGKQVTLNMERQEFLQAWLLPHLVTHGPYVYHQNERDCYTTI